MRYSTFKSSLIHRISFGEWVRQQGLHESQFQTGTFTYTGPPDLYLTRSGSVFQVTSTPREAFALTLYERYKHLPDVVVDFREQQTSRGLFGLGETWYATGTLLWRK